MDAADRVDIPGLGARDGGGACGACQLPHRKGAGESPFCKEGAAGVEGLVVPHEMEHLEACYGAYHANGGNGTGTLMYERIKKCAVIVTKVEEPIKIGGTE